MTVERAASAGTCYGVQRALDLAHSAVAAHGSAASLGPLIHNPRAVAQLEEEGLAVVERVEQAAAPCVVVRSHGVPPDVRRALDASGADVVDATCPHVLRAQKAARELAAAHGTVVVVGEAGHPEVTSLCAWARDAGGRAVAVLDPRQLPDDLGARVGVVVQTTMRRPVLEAVLASLQGRGVEADVRDTVCDATQKRQEAARELAARADAMIVVGGRASSNTTRLAEICAALCPACQHVEDAADIDFAALEGARLVGVTAGASTPDDQIEAVIAALGEHGC